MRSTCQPTATLMTHPAAPPYRVVVRPQTAHPMPPLWAVVCPPAASASREHLTHVGFSVLSSAHRVDGINPGEGWRAETGCWTGLLQPKCTGCSPKGRLRFCLPPKHPLCVCAIHACVRASECELSEKHTFWQKTCDITHLMALRPCLKL